MEVEIVKENAFTKWWGGFADKHPGAAKWIREGGLFFLFKIGRAHV